MAVRDLGDRGHVHGVVELAVAPPRQPEDLVASRGDFDWSGPVVGGEVVPVGKTVDVADITDHGGGYVRPDAEDLGNRGARRLDGHLETLFGLRIWVSTRRKSAKKSVASS